MSSCNGKEQHLVASHPGNRHAERSSAFARRSLAQDIEVQELVADIMAAPHTHPLDEAGAVEIAKLTVLIDRIDADLAERGLRNRKGGEPRALLDMRLRASRRLAEWLDRFGMTPLSRATWAKQMAEGGLAAEIARRRAQAQEEETP
jgi:hypothetical protein